MEHEYATWEEWVASQPEVVQKLIQEFPANTVIRFEGKVFYIIGYNEDDCLLVSQIDPKVDYACALETKEYLHAQHLRDAMKSFGFIVYPRIKISQLPGRSFEVKK